MYRRIRTRAAVTVITAITAITALSVPGAASADSNGFGKALSQAMSCEIIHNGEAAFVNQAGQLEGAASDAAWAQARALSNLYVASGCMT